MRLVARIRAAARNLVRRDDVERALDDELRAYVDLLAAEKMRAGVAPVDAMRAALIEAGGIEQTKEAVRDVRTGAHLDALRRDVGHALRGLRRSPGLTAAALVTLAVGIGINSALFTIVYSALARPLPVRDAERVVNVYQRMRRGGVGGRDVQGNTSFLSYMEFEEYAKAPAFASSAVYRSRTVTAPSVGTGSIESELVSCAYFRTMRTRIVLGRDFLGDDCAHPGSGPVAVISHDAWRSAFGGDSSVVGRVLNVNGTSITVIGVAEPEFNGIGLQPSSMWIPITLQPTLDHGRDSILVRPNVSWLMMAARLADGSTIEDARAQTQLIGRRLDERYAGRIVTPTVARGALINFPEVANEGALPIAFVVLLGFAIVAMACASVVNLLLARGLARRREVAIRLAIGASRRQLVQQFLIESGVLALGGAAIGMAFVLATPPILRALSPIRRLQLDTAPDAGIVAYVFLVAIGTTLLVGLAPALQATSVDLASAFKGTAVFGRRSIRPSRLRNAVVGFQIAGSALFLAMAGLFLRGAQRAMVTDPGYATKNVVAFSFNAGPLGYDTTRARVLYRTIIDRVRQSPGVVDAAIVDKLPLLATNRIGVSLDMDSAKDPKLHVVDDVVASASYFNTMGLRIVRGSTFDTTSLADRDREAVVSVAMASMLWGDGDPIGKRFNAANQWFRVVGVASNAATSSLDHVGAATAYLEVRSPLERWLVVRTVGSTAGVIAMVPAIARAFDPQLIATSERIEDRMALMLFPARLIAGSTATLGVLALVLAVVGVAGVVSFGLGQRRHEVAVRLAVGATGMEVVALMMRQVARPIVIGLALGLAIALGIGQVVRGFLFGASPLDPIAYAVVLLVLGLSALLAAYVPSRRAAAVDPASVLREE